MTELFRQYATAQGRDVHHDALLSGVAIQAFSDGSDEFVGEALFPLVNVDKQSNRYPIIRKGAFLRATNAFRAAGTRPKRIQFDVSSDAYFADNYALAGEITLEDLSNADNPFNLRANTTRAVTLDLRRGQEVRIANIVTSASNVGSGFLCTGTNKWSNAASDPLAAINTAHAFIRSRTGLIANTAVVDWDTMMVMRRHPLLLDLYKYTSGGELNDSQIGAILKVGTVLVGKGVRENQQRNVDSETASSMTNIWGNNVLLARIDPAAGSLQTATLGLRFGWRNPIYPANFAVLTQQEAGAGEKKVEVIEAGHYQDEKLVAPELGYLIANTL